MRKIEEDLRDRHRGCEEAVGRRDREGDGS